MYKEIHNYSDIKNKILETVEKVSKPIIGTLTPKGSNVIYSSAYGCAVTNDGVTIAKQIVLQDNVENTIAQLLIHSAVRTNLEAGDGTTTSILLSREFIKEGFKLLDSGWNPMNLKRTLEKVGDKVLENLKELSMEIEGEKKLNWIAKVSSNNDEEIAKDVVKAVLVAGEKGLVLLQENIEDKTEIKIDDGFLLKEGMFSPHLTNRGNRFIAEYRDVHVLVTDKRIYSAEEAISILKVLADKGIKNIVIVARDFIGQSPNVFLTNHDQKKMNILLIKDTTATDSNSTTLEDLAAYLGTYVLTDKTGGLTSEIEISDFGIVERVVSDLNQTLFLNKKTKQVKERIKAIEDQIAKMKDEYKKKELEERIARMTSGTVTIFVGGKTPIETRERILRFEDAINATRNSQKDGYVVGGGLALYNAFENTKLNKEDLDIFNLFKSVCLSPLKQIAKNCDVHYTTLIQKVEEGKDKNIGYNAITDKFEDLHRAGIIEPLTVVEKAFKNALSIANIILSANFIITEEKDDDKENSPKTKK